MTPNYQFAKVTSILQTDPKNLVEISQNYQIFQYPKLIKQLSHSANWQNLELTTCLKANSDLQNEIP